MIVLSGKFIKAKVQSRDVTDGELKGELPLLGFGFLSFIHSC